MFTIDDSGVLKWWTPKALVFPQIFKIGNKLDDNLGSPNSGNQKSACRLKSPSERSQTHRTEASHPAGGRSPSRYCRSCSLNSPGPPGSCPLHPVAAGACCCWRRRPIAAPCWNSLQGCGPGCCRWFPASPAGCCRSCAKNDPRSEGFEHQANKDATWPLHLGLYELLIFICHDSLLCWDWIEDRQQTAEEREGEERAMTKTTQIERTKYREEWRKKWWTMQKKGEALVEK